jgi:hypothetical protein
MIAKCVEDKENKLLRLAVQELQTRDEKNLIIGKLRQQILALESGELRSRQKIEALNSTKLHLETENLQHEERIEKQDKLIYNLRLKTNSRIDFMRKNMNNMRNKHYGIVSLSKHEVFAELI